MFIVGRARFYAQPSATAAAPAQTLLPNLYDESVDTFFTPQVNLRILPNLYTDPDTFFTPKVSFVLKPSLYVDADTFFSPTVAQPSGGQSLLPALYTDPDTFFTPAVKGLNRLTPGLYVDADTFFTPVVKNLNILSPGLYVDLDTFFSPTVGRRNTLTPTLYVDPDTFFTHVLSQGISDQDLTPFLYSSLVNFFSPAVGGGEEEPPDLSFSQGGGKQRKFREVKSSNVESVLHEGDTLTIRYRDGSVYNYSDVPEKKFNRLVKSRSPGSFVHTKIKDKHDYRRFY